MFPRIFGAGTVPETGRRKLMALDGIRGVAVLMVMASHFERFLPAYPALVPFKSVAEYGWSGVDLFFVLSGFLITGILVQTRTAINYFQSFYIRRFLRIFPIYYATLVVIFGAAAIFPGLPNVPAAAQRWTYFAYVCNWIPFWTGTWPPNVVGHFWSLAVEEQFYLLWPAVVVLTTPKKLFQIAIILSIAAFVIRCVWVLRSGPTEALMLGTFTRMDSLLLGAVASLIFSGPRTNPVLRFLTPIAALCLGAVVAGIMVSAWGRPPAASFGFIATAGYSLMAVGFAALVLGAAVGDGTRNLVQRCFRFGALTRVGRYSYGMYVYHVPLLGICELLVWRHVPVEAQRNPLVAATYVVFLGLATFVVAAVSFEFFERRILELKRKAEPLFREKAVLVTGPASEPLKG